MLINDLAMLEERQSDGWLNEASGRQFDATGFSR